MKNTMGIKMIINRLIEQYFTYRLKTLQLCRDIVIASEGKGCVILEL